MSSGKTSIFLLGATGYVGGQILTRLLAHPRTSTFEITVLVRSQEKAKLLESKFDVKAVVGHHGELGKLEQFASQAHVVFSCSDSDDLPMIKAILSGLKNRHATFGDLPIFIHTSGTGVLTDDARGMYATDTIYSDMNVAQIESLPPTALHRNVDLEIVSADQQGYGRAYIILPSTIYGLAKGPLVEAGISNPHSMQIPYIVKASIDRKQAGMVGAGKPIWPNVHIDDVADLYIVLFDAIMTRPDAVAHGREGYYFAENGEHTWYDISKAVGRALVELGVSETDEPTTLSREELIKYFGSEAMGNYGGTNSRCRADRGRSIGWKPKYTTADMLASIKSEVEIFLRKASSA
ncbi:NAD(P)-binding protein [Obba rivulosa]|uniref:NAD(P)-binding protein n=1 Tax=Obba rivulosa TaxID=1052685 RepID=A0A8E2DNH7_9APHY|nr:NAD(P)-binding protein [Obba rivulosa]